MRPLLALPVVAALTGCVSAATNKLLKEQQQLQRSVGQ
jgi:hypothetical protein